MTKGKVAAALVLLVAVAGAAWLALKPGSGGEQRTPSGRVPREAPDLLPQAERPLQEATAVLITIQGHKFVPALISARVGDTIEWRNSDTVAHSVVGGEFRSPNIAPGKSYQAVVTKAGTVDYTCGIHPDMGGQIQVQPAR